MSSSQDPANGGGSSSSSNNTCVICLESLFAPPAREDTDSSPGSSSSLSNATDIGVATPCGHPCHMSCFEQWSAFQNLGKSHRPGRNRGKEMPAKVVPCPTCQRPTESFVKVFLRAEQPSHMEPRAPSDFHDDMSSSSDEDDDPDGEHNSHSGSGQRSGNGQAKHSASSIPNLPTTILVRDSLGSRYQRRPKRERCKLATRSPAGSAKPTVHRRRPLSKHRRYKRFWRQACDQIKALKQESRNRKDSHHADLAELERVNWTNYKLMQELERVVSVTSFRRNVFGLLCFGAGWFCKKKTSS